MNVQSNKKMDAGGSSLVRLLNIAETWTLLRDTSDRQKISPVLKDSSDFSEPIKVILLREAIHNAQKTEEFDQIFKGISCLSSYEEQKRLLTLLTERKTQLYS